MKVSYEGSSLSLLADTPGGRCYVMYTLKLAQFAGSCSVHRPGMRYYIAR